MKAFPTPTFSINNEARVTAVGGEGGMDLRDYFAAKAMQGIVSRGILTEVPLELYAENAYRMADAMMEARKSDSSIK
jgi:hypothetical protein